MGEKKNRFLSSDSIRRADAGAFVLLLSAAALVLSAGNAGGISAAFFERPRERSLGLDQTGAVILRAAPSGAPGTRCRFETGEWLLYGIGGLRTYAASVDIDAPSWELRLSAAVLDAPVGRESALESGVCVPLGRFRLGASLRWEAAGLDGCESAHFLSLRVSALLRVTDRVAVCTRAANMRLAGETLPGAAASVGIVLSPEGAVSAVAHLEISAAGAASFRVASRVRLGRRALFSLGYEEDTGSLDASVWIRIGSVGLDAGSSFHPVLGVSQGLFVSWGRGW